MWNAGWECHAVVICLSSFGSLAHRRVFDSHVAVLKRWGCALSVVCCIEECGLGDCCGLRS